MRRIRLEGNEVRRLRENRDRGSTQKELAHEIGISERKLRAIENAGDPVATDIAERLARALGVPIRELDVARDSELPEPPPVPSRVPAAAAITQRARVVPRFDTHYASVVRNEAELLKIASGGQVIVCHILTPLTAETNAYAKELLQILQSLTWGSRPFTDPIGGVEELAVRQRIRELLVLLKGNDVWVYADTNFKTLPESFEVQPKSNPRQYELQFIVAFGPAGEYGETSIEVPIDHGQPWVSEFSV